MNVVDRFRPKPLLILLGSLALTGIVLSVVEAALGVPAAEAAPNEKKVKVTLKVDNAGNPVAINKPDLDPVTLSRGGQHVARWYLDTTFDASIRIEMNDGTKPFREHPRGMGREALSGPPVDGPGDYKYSIIVTLKNGTKLPVLDPVIHVDP